MDCPGCTFPMEAVRFSARYGGELEIDVCQHCNGIWFDGRESLQLAPGATLKLFQSLYERRTRARQPLAETKQCPRCEATLVETFDMQRGTRFTYFRCESHGRYTTFFQFLREKNLVRAPSPKQLAELKAQVKQVTCSNCGGPIVLAETATCPHCQAPVSILSEESINETLKQLSAAEVKRTTVDPEVAANLIKARLQATREYSDAAGPANYTWNSAGASSGTDLLEFGANVLMGIIDIAALF